MKLALRPLDLGEIATVVILGWLAASALVATAIMLWASVEGGIAFIVFLPLAWFMAVVAAIFASIPWALPTGILAVAGLHATRASGRTGFVALTATGCVYAAALAYLPEAWAWWEDFWWVAPAYGAVMGFFYARSYDA